MLHSARLLLGIRQPVAVGQRLQEAAAHRNALGRVQLRPLAPAPAAKLAEALGVEVREGDEREEAEVGVSSPGVINFKPVCVGLVLPAGSGSGAVGVGRPAELVSQCALMM